MFCVCAQSTIDSEGFKGGTRDAPIMPRDAVSRTANVEQKKNQSRRNTIRSNDHVQIQCFADLSTLYIIISPHFLSFDG